MNVAIFGGFNRRPFPPGWTKETVITVFGGGDLDLSSSPPGPGARLTAIAILGGIKILVAPGTQVSVSGFGLFGGREVTCGFSGSYSVDGAQVQGTALVGKTSVMFHARLKLQSEF